MRKLLTITLTLLTTITVFGQNFEGRITYHNTFKSKNPNATDEQFTSMMGTEQEYYIKGGDYKSILNGTLFQWQLYINKDNKLYFKMSNSDIVFWNDGNEYNDSIITTQLTKGVTEILGYKCDELVLICKNGIEKYYFNSKLAIDPKLYINHHYGNWYDYLNQAGAVPLKMVMDKQQYAMVSIAVEVKPMKLEDKEFQLPANVKTSKSPY